MTDWQLLQQYRRQRAEQAFARLVERHVGLVYHVCRRRLRDAHLAEDVTQAVFVLLARRGPRQPTGAATIKTRGGRGATHGRHGGNGPRAHR